MLGGRPHGTGVIDSFLAFVLSRRDTHHARARDLFAACAPPLRCCEAVLVYRWGRNRRFECL